MRVKLKFSQTSGDSILRLTDNLHPFFALGCNSNIIVKLGDFIKFYGKIPDIFVLITGHSGLFKTPTLRLGEAGTIQTQSQIRRLKIAKTDFKSVRKTIMAIKHLKNQFQKCPKKHSHLKKRKSYL